MGAGADGRPSIADPTGCSTPTTAATRPACSASAASDDLACPGLAHGRQGALARLHRHVSARDGGRLGRGADRHPHLPAAQGRAAVRRAAVRGDAVTLGDMVSKKITMLEVVCCRLDTATEQLGEALAQVRLLTDQRAARRSWWCWRQG